MTKQEEIQREFLRLINKHTQDRKIDWVRSLTDIGFVYCLTPHDLIIFEVRGGGAGSAIDPAENVAGIVSRCRNITYMWLQHSPGFDDLLALLREAPVDDNTFVEFRKRAHMTPLHALELLNG